MAEIFMHTEVVQVCFGAECFHWLSLYVLTCVMETLTDLWESFSFLLSACIRRIMQPLWDCINGGRVAE